MAMHIHPVLTIIFDGEEQPIPKNIGIQLDGSGNATSFYRLHTHDDSGTIHVETPPPVRDFHLRDFFAVWEQPFDSTQILDFVADENDTITMTVNGSPSTEFGDLLLKDADQIVITATTVDDPPPPTHTPYDGKIFAVGDATGKVQVLRATDGTIQAEFQAYGRDYQGPISIAVGDVNGDGFQDVVTAPTRATPHVKVFDGKAISQATFTESTPDAHLITSFMAYGTEFNVGVHVAVGHVANNGNETEHGHGGGGHILAADIITAASVGNPHVKVYRGSAIKDGTFGANPESHLIASYFAYDLNNNIGATVAVGRVAGSDHDDVICGSASGNPHVKVYRGFAMGHGEFNNFNPDASLVTSFLAYEQGRNLGVYVASGDTDGDGFEEVICAPFGNSSQVTVYNGKAISEGTAPASAILDQFFAYGQQYNTGSTIGAADFNGDGKAEIITGPTQGSAHYRVVPGDSSGVTPAAILENIASDLSTIIAVSA
jgi:hypothetical protein